MQLQPLPGLALTAQQAGQQEYKGQSGGEGKDDQGHFAGSGLLEPVGEQNMGGIMPAEFKQLGAVGF
ncbi:hypothetical protein PSEUDO8AS_70134 [Pseudomonas sp. 8AS]|nr:hypothetical protein PSEUDO8AS_70134 [Pseudomonas sp. 8AS]